MITGATSSGASRLQMVIGLLTVFVVITGVLGAVAIVNRDSSDVTSASGPGDVTGEIALAGCDVAPDQLQVFGKPWQLTPVDLGAESPTLEPTPSATESPTDSASPSPTDSPSTTESPAASPSGRPSPSGSPTTPSPTLRPTPTRTVVPTLSPSPSQPNIRVNPAVYPQDPAASSVSPTNTDPSGSPATDPTTKPTPSQTTPAMPIAAVSETRATVTEASPGVFRFRLAGDRPGLAFRLRLAVTVPGCEKVAWTPIAGLKYGSALAGGEPAKISGAVLDTELQVLQGTTDAQRLDGAVLGTWGTEDVVDWTDPLNARRVFHWASAAPGITSGRWEVSALPFPDTCLGASPVIASDVAPYATGALGQNFMDTSFTINFADIYAMVKATAADSAPTDAITDIYYQGATIAKILAPPAVWVRVVPTSVDTSEACAAAPSNQVKISFGTTNPAQVQNLDGWGGARPVDVDWQTYTPYRPSRASVTGGVPLIEIIAPHTLPKAGDTTAFFNDPMGSMILSSGQYPFGATPPVGQRLVLWQPAGDDSLWDEFGEALWSVAETLGAGYVVDAINWVASTYEDVKAGVVAVVADVITAAGLVDCGPGSTCREGIAAALTAGLVALGIPPSLPNFSELANQGLDYLAAQVAQETGLPVEQAMDVAREAVSRLATTGGSAAGAAWPGFGEWYTDLRLPELGSMTLRVTRPADSPDGPNVGALNLTGDVYQSATTAPQLLPGQSITFPITLLPQTADLGFSGGDPSYTTKAWTDNIFKPSEQTSLTVAAGPQSSVLGTLEFPTHTPLGYAGVPTTISNGG